MFMGVGATDNIFLHTTKKRFGYRVLAAGIKLSRTGQSITRTHESKIHVIFMLKLDWFDREKPARPIMEAI